MEYEFRASNTVQCHDIKEVGLMAPFAQAFQQQSKDR